MKKNSPIFLIMIAVGLFYTFINPQFNKTKALIEEQGQYKNVLNNVSALYETRDQLEYRLADIPSTEISRLSKILPNTGDVVSLAVDLDGIAAKYGFSLKSAQVDLTSRNSGSVFLGSSSEYEKVTVVVQFVTTYEGFKSFIADIENSLRITDIRGLSFRVGESDYYEYRMVIDAYWLNDSAR
jgi:hypothetical protein